MFVDHRKRYAPLGPQEIKEVLSQKLQSKLTPKSSSLDLDSSVNSVDAGLEENSMDYALYREEMLASCHHAVSVELLS